MASPWQKVDSCKGCLELQPCLIKPRRSFNLLLSQCWLTVKFQLEPRARCTTVLINHPADFDHHWICPYPTLRLTFNYDSVIKLQIMWRQLSFAGDCSTGETGRQVFVGVPKPWLWHEWNCPVLLHNKNASTRFPVFESGVKRNFWPLRNFWPILFVSYLLFRVKE